MANGSRSRAFFNGPASTGSKPSAPTSSITTVFFAASSPATGMRGFTGYFRGRGHIACARGVEGLEDEDARCPARTCSPAEVSKPRTSCKPLGPMPKGLVQSITILPARLPRPLTAADVADRCRDHYHLGVFDGYGRSFDALFGQRRIFRISGIAQAPNHILAIAMRMHA